MRSRYFFVRSFVFAGILIIGCMISLNVWAQTGYPNKPIEFVCHSIAGSPSDSFVRNVVRMLQVEKIITAPMVVVNKAGGSGAVAMAYLARKAGDPYTIMGVTGNIVTTPMLKPKVPGYKDFTLIGKLAVDVSVVAVKTESPFRSIKDVVEAAQKSPKRVSYGGTSIGSPVHILMYLLQKSGRCEFNYISFSGENESLVALLGGHVDVAAFNPSTIMGQLEANNLRILGIALPNRLVHMPDIPTLKEEGFDVIVSMPRGIVAPNGIPDDAKNYFISAFQKLIRTKSWEKYLRDNLLYPGGEFGEDYFKYLESFSVQIGGIFQGLGLIK